MIATRCLPGWHGGSIGDNGSLASSTGFPGILGKLCSVIGSGRGLALRPANQSVEVILLVHALAMLLEIVVSRPCLLALGTILGSTDVHLGALGKDIVYASVVTVKVIRGGETFDVAIAGLNGAAKGAGMPQHVLLEL